MSQPLNKMKFNCQICGGKLRQKVSKWNFYCQNCDYWYANLTPTINEGIEIGFDANYLSNLSNIRAKNFNIILKAIKSLCGDSLTILDVGCASGLFMSLAIQEGYKVTGVEPNMDLHNYVKARGFNVLCGYFPDILSEKDKYDLIIFNDVFEHIPDINKVLFAVKEHLTEHGILVINLPDSDGFIFQLSKILFLFSFKAPWERMWQTMFSTPHIHYFNKKSLDLLVTGKYRFTKISKSTPLNSFNTDGLWHRISVDKNMTLIRKIFLYCSTLIIYPLSLLLKKDTFFTVYQKNEK